MAEVHVDSSIWDRLSSDEQKQITDILRGTGLIGPADQLVGASKPTEVNTFKKANPKCILGCNAAEQAAVTACVSLGPLATVCISAAHAAADACRNAC
ncbi:hypothetical protein G6L24_26645 [Agrobacterium tumefaciens]|nr:hypothetical protein [Agrobacterium tumefaciens]